MHGLGSVAIEPSEPVFHHPWERRAFALTVAMGATGSWNIDMARSAREDRPPHEYLADSYYEKWLFGLERLLVERDLVDADELTGGTPSRAPSPGVRRLAAANVDETLARGAPTLRATMDVARFVPGDHVRARTVNPTTHTRLPRYVRGHVGVVERAHGCHVFPDASAHGLGEQPSHLYTVVFAGTEVWGADADPTVTVSIDAWEPYLEAAP